MRIGVKMCGVMCTCTLLAAPVFGQESGQPETTTANPDQQSSGFGNISYTFKPYFAYQTSAGAADATGSVTTSRGGADLIGSFQANDRTFVTMLLSGEYVSYNFEEDAGLPSGQNPPLSAAQEVSAALLINRVIDDEWMLTAGGFVNAAWENGADFGDAVTGGGMMGLQYRFNRNLSLGAGLLVATQLEGNLRVLPVPLIEAHYDFDSQWSFSASTVEGAALTFAPADQDVWRAKLGIGWDYTEYRLDDGDPRTIVVGGGIGPGMPTTVQGSAPDGVLSELRVPLSLMLEWDMAPGWTAEAGVALNLVHEFDVEDLNGEHLANQNFGLAPEFRIGVSGRF
ncbi:MAG: hypothetical protein H6815_09725 [Phycisphaeraceae bacterium]|nr:hypothetical protein [Phycisphaerales bacterium]MCB9860715.1 hypothetical protein [Phycisphaeraceae bacterium]